MKIESLTLKIFVIYRGPEVWSYGNASGFFTSIIAIILTGTFKQYYGFDGMFVISLMLIIVSAILLTSINENQPFKYSEIYEERGEGNKNFNNFASQLK